MNEQSSPLPALSPPRKRDRTALSRWLKFNLVGAIGIGVQLAALAVFRSVLRFNYLPATAMAVETAVIHRFYLARAFYLV